MRLITWNVNRRLSLLAAGLEIDAAVYHHAWRDDGLSDHSALEVDLRTAAG